MAASPQTSVTFSPPRAVAGMLADSGPVDIISARVDADAGIAPGLVVCRTSGGDKAAGFPSSIALDADAILVAFATALAIQTIDTEADGVIGLGRITPARKITVARSSNANQDAVTAVLSYMSAGVLLTQNLAFADAGNDSFTSTFDADRFVSLVIPAQSGTGGTTTIGVAAATELTASDVLGVSVVDSSKTLETVLSQDNNEVYEDQTVMPTLRKGRIFVVCETAFRAGDVPYVRLVATGDEKLGAVRAGNSDSGDCLPWRDARFVSSGAAGFAVLAVLMP